MLRFVIYSLLICASWLVYQDVAAYYDIETIDKTITKDIQAKVEARKVKANQAKAYEQAMVKENRCQQGSVCPQS